MNEISTTQTAKPAMRPLDIRPLTQDGEAFLMLIDNDGFAANAAVPQLLANLLALFDGTRDIGQIIADYQKLGGEELPISFLEKTIADLDENFMLDSPRFRAKLEDRRIEYSNSSARVAAFAGRAYPEDESELRPLLDGYAAQSNTLNAPQKPRGEIKGCVVPHIDFARGGVVEALAYRDLKNEDFDVLVVLGIAHSGVRYPFCTTTKSYDTPLGVCKTDIEFVHALQNRVGTKLTDEEIAHQNEHSIEFVAVWLQHIFGTSSTRSAPRIVPILCGGFHRETRTKTSPMQNSEVLQFITALRETVGEWESKGSKVGMVASVDLSHVGSRFGDERRLSYERLLEIETEDRAFLACAEIGNADAIHQSMAKDNNARNVDAHPALYTLFAAFPAWRAQLLAYDQAFDEAANSVVSFAAMTIYEDDGL